MLEYLYLQYITQIQLIHNKSLSSLTFPLQQVQTCVWDVSSPFKIVLVNASKVNAEETAKVNCHFVYVHETLIYFSINISLCHTQTLDLRVSH